MKHSFSRQSAFTLVEMAIVLAIIGLLAGSVVAGSNMIRNSRVQHVLVDAQGYWSAIYAFQKKYDYLPGDFPLAVRVWGKADGNATLTTNCAAPATDVANIQGTCNGNGDGYISPGSETYRDWQQLRLATLIAGNYNGAQGSAGVNHVVPGSNVPAGKLHNSAYWVYSWGYLTGNTDSRFFDGNYNNAMLYGGSVTGSWNYNPVLYPKEAYQIDVKADDGIPSQGDIRGPKPGWRANCVNGTTADVAVYNKGYDALACVLVFMQGFQQTGSAQ